MPRPKPSLALALVAGFLFVQAATPAAQAAPIQLPGPDIEGRVLLPNLWSLHPAGRQLDLGSLPEHLALHPSGRWLAVLHAGYGEHSVWIVDSATLAVTSKAVLSNTFYGLEFSADGTELFASGGQTATVHRFHFAEGQLTEAAPVSFAALALRRPVPADATDQAPLIGGLALDEAAKTLYAAATWGDTLGVAPLGGGAEQLVTMPDGAFPYGLTLDGRTHRLFVSEWGRAMIAVVDTRTNAVTVEWTTGSHPTEMRLSPDGSLLYVACANANEVSVLETATGRELERINTALYPNGPAGSAPSSLDLTADGKILAVANSSANDVALFNVETRGQAHALGFLPSGWYPTSVRIDGTGKRLFVANGKGDRSLPNVPADPAGGARLIYAPELLKGSLSAVDFPTPTALAGYTQEVYGLSPLKADESPTTPAPAGSPVPGKVGAPSPIKHVVYVIKENRTYDQVFGDVAGANGDPSLALFGEKVTPNHHALAREYVLLDNVYCDGEVSAAGHEWSMGAYATDFVEKMWPLNYRPGNTSVPYPSEGSEDPIARPAGGYLWDQAAAKGLTFESLGEFINNGDLPTDPATPSVPALAGHIDPAYRGFDLDYPDQKRADRFVEDLAEFEAAKAMPSLLIVRLPNDHTKGTATGARTPRAYVADNDLALGRVVDALSHSSFWATTAVFVIEDDSQNGPDHVDAHRTVSLVVSPYTKRHAVDSTMYSTSSFLRTMELILGLDPMSLFDAAAQPMYASFQATPDLTPYTAKPAQISLTETNTAAAYGAALSNAMSWKKEDANDEAVLNDIIWRSVDGADSVMPPPRRAAFVYPHAAAATKGDVAKGDDD